MIGPFCLPVVVDHTLTCCGLLVWSAKQGHTSQRLQQRPTGDPGATPITSCCHSGCTCGTCATAHMSPNRPKLFLDGFVCHGEPVNNDSQAHKQPPRTLRGSIVHTAHVVPPTAEHIPLCDHLVPPRLTNHTWCQNARPNTCDIPTDYSSGRLLLQMGML